MLQPVAELDRILGVLEPAEALAESLGDQARVGRVLGGLCNTWQSRGAPDRALTLVTRAYELGNTLGDVALQIEATLRLGAVHYSLGNYSTAVSFLRQTLDLTRGRPESERLGFVGLVSVLMNVWLSMSLSELGQFSEAQARVEEGLNGATTADQPFSLIGAHFALGLLGLRQGHFDRAAAAFRSSLELSRRWDIPAGGTARQAGPAPWPSRVGAMKPSACWRDRLRPSGGLEWRSSWRYGPPGSARQHAGADVRRRRVDSPKRLSTSPAPTRSAGTRRGRCACWAISRRIATTGFSTAEGALPRSAHAGGRARDASSGRSLPPRTRPAVRTLRGARAGPGRAGCRS